MHGLYRSGVGHILMKRRRKAQKVPVLLFHRVAPGSDPFWPPLHPESFRRILSFFKKHYRFLPLEELYGGSQIPTDAAFITFDDAFQDFEDHALPILKELGLPATLFVPSGSIDSGEAIWPSLVDRYVEEEWEKGKPVLELHEERIPWGEWSSLDRESCAGELKQKLMSLPYEVQLETKDRLEGRGYSEKVRPMSWDGLKELPHDIELGAHTVTHPYLPSVIKEKDIEQEMRESKERISEMTARTVRSFAYPFGGFDERAERIASDLFDIALTTEGTGVDLQCPALRRIPRIDVQDAEPREALLRVNGFHRFLSRSFRP